MSDMTRRDALQRLALAIAAAGAIDTLDAHEAHLAAQQATAAAGGKYAPKALSAHEFATLERLSDLIIPADDKPGALQAEVAPWIDMLLIHGNDFFDRRRSGLHLPAHRGGQLCTVLCLGFVDGAAYGAARESTHACADERGRTGQRA